MADSDQVMERLNALLDRVEEMLPRQSEPVAWDTTLAARWRRHRGGGNLDAVYHTGALRLADLLCVDRQKQELTRNTRQFMEGLPANNALLWGSRGTGKSSLIKALLNEFHPRGLRLVEVEKHDLLDLPDIVEQLRGHPERFLIYCDDLSFEANEPNYKALKVVLDGSLSATPENVLVYATSNRRHLMPETMQDNLEARHIQGELHPSEASEEKISLSERFGIWLSFYPFDQEQYLTISSHWLRQLGLEPDSSSDAEWRAAALRWALGHGSRSGRVAWQFARDWAGRARLED